MMGRKLRMIGERNIKAVLGWKPFGEMDLAVVFFGEFFFDSFFVVEVVC